ncbi:MAG: GerMN domain-containing protein [Selenomonadaceae bacterium]|nr:GerMN domain-containing protein [Selenomonadaceae bacterium]
MNIIKKILMLMMISIMLICVGCDNQGNTGGDGEVVDNPKQENKQEVLTEPENKEPGLPPNPPPKSKDNQKNNEVRKQQEMKIKVYYPDESGLRLIGVNREIKVSDNDDKYKAAVEAVMTPPTEKNLTSVIPNNSPLLSVKVKDGTAIVDLDKKIKNGFVGGSTGEEFLIGSVVNTLTEFNEVKSVRFLIDGKEVETLAGHMDLSEPIKRMDNLMKN